MTLAKKIITPSLETPLSGFENINRYFDKYQKKIVAKILPGEYYVTMNDELISTVLGSCISACIRCKAFQIGGMNHFMLPASTDGSSSWTANDTSAAARYGNYAMEHMINDILKHGASRKHLEVKLIGGGQILKDFSNVGDKNIAFVRDYIVTEGLSLAGEDLGDIYPRKVIYNPTTGKVKVKKLESLHNDTILQREMQYKHQIEDQPVAGEVELF